MTENTKQTQLTNNIINQNKERSTEPQGYPFKKGYIIKSCYRSIQFTSTCCYLSKNLFPGLGPAYEQHEAFDSIDEALSFMKCYDHPCKGYPFEIIELWRRDENN